MSTERKTRLINELTEKLRLLEEQKSVSDDEANTLAEKRDKLNERVRNSRSEIQELRSQRDEMNEKVKKLKLQRNDIKARIQEKIEEIKKLGEENRVLAEKKPSRSHHVLEEEVESIDWRIQTTPLTLQEDKELVGRVRQLESQLNIHKKIEQLKKKIQDLRTEITSLKTEGKQCHEALMDNVKKSQELHGKMLARIGESRKIKMEADEVHKQFIAAKDRGKPLQQEIAATWSKIRQLRGEIRTDEEKEKKQSEDVLRQTLEKKAIEKLKKGEKLSWEEFQLLAQKGNLTAQD